MKYKTPWLARAAQEEDNCWSGPHISGWKSKCNDSTQCWINTYYFKFFFFFFFFGLFHFPSSLHSKGDRRSWDTISIGRGKSELLQGSECLPSSRDKCPLLWSVSLRELERPKTLWSRERKAFLFLDTSRFPVTAGFTSKLYFCVAQLCRALL